MIQCRRFEPSELDECTRLFLKVFSNEPWNDKWESFEEARQYLKEFVENPVFEGFIACENAEIIAACFGHKRTWWMGKEYYIDEMYVDFERQGQGIGSRLFEFIRETMIKQGLKTFVLLTGAGMPAERFYEKLGFKRSKNIIFMSQKN